MPPTSDTPETLRAHSGSWLHSKAWMWWFRETSRAGGGSSSPTWISTVIGQECIDELADYAGLKDKVARITERAMQGELDFQGALRERVRLLAGLDQLALSRCLTERVEVTAGAETLVQTMRAGGASCLLVSGGFLSFAEPIAKTVGFDRVKANRLVFAGGKLSGEVGDPIVDAMAKRDALIEARDQLNLGPADVLAIGDGANDKLMIEEAGLRNRLPCQASADRGRRRRAQAPWARRLAMGARRSAPRLVQGLTTFQAQGSRAGLATLCTPLPPQPALHKGPLGGGSPDRPAQRMAGVRPTRPTTS